MEPKYDKNNPESIEDFGKRLIGKTLREALSDRVGIENNLNEKLGAHGKAAFGDLVERFYYGIKPDNTFGEPDFPKAGVELKTTPIKKINSGLYSAKERLVLGLINYVDEAKRDFYSSSFFKKNQRIMLISYLHDEGVDVGGLLIKLAKLLDYEKLPAEDRKIIEEDWEKIHVKIRENRAHELSEGDTLYLAACTKAVDSRSLRPQADGVSAKPRAYSYKSGYMTRLVRRELGMKEEEKAVKDIEARPELSFEDNVIRKFDIFIGKTVDEIAAILEMPSDNNPKHELAILARRMLGIKGMKIEEFDAAEVSMKTIQLTHNGTPKESMSFPYIRYDEIINEKWDADEEAGEKGSAFQEQLEKRFLFVIFQCEGDCKDGDKKRLKKVMFWTMPYADREDAKHTWLEVVKLIKANRIDDLPGSSETRVAHIRPHGLGGDDKAIFNGVDVDKKSFWLNASYLKDIVA